MAIQSTLVINDGKATPTAHNFDPKGAKRVASGQDVALWRDQSVANAVGYPSITETHSPVNSNGMEKFRFLIDVPTLEQASSGGTFVPPPTRAYGSIGVVEVWVHQRASQAEVNDIAAYVKNFAATTYFANAIQKREAAW